MITLYKPDETNFEKNGIGTINQATIEPEVEEELNAGFSFTFEYPLNAKHGKEITNGSVVKAEIPDGTFQLFRIHRPVKTMGRVVAHARHIFYDLAGNLIEDTNIVGKSGEGAMLQMQGATQYPHPFELHSDIPTVATARMVRYNPVQALLDSSKANSFISRWGGEIERNNFRITMRERRGNQTPHKIRHRKDLLGYEASLDDSTIVTRLYPIGFDGLELPERYIDSPNIDTDKPKIGIIKYSDIKAAVGEYADDEDAIPEAEAIDLLRATAEKEFTENHIDEPEANYKIDFVTLERTNEYKAFSNLQKVNIGDVVEVEHQEDGITITARLLKYKWNPLTKRYNGVELGNHAATITGSGQGSEIDRIDRDLEDLRGTTNQVLIAANGKNAVSFGTQEPANPIEGDLWFDEGSDPAKMKHYNGTAWEPAETNAETIRGTMNFEQINVLGLNANAITAGSLNLGQVSVSNGMEEILFINSEGQVSLNVDSITISYGELATKQDLEESAETISDEAAEVIEALVTIKDTRNDNYAPSHYEDNHADQVVREYKTSTAIGAPTNVSNGIMETSYSNGVVTQEYKAGGRRYTRDGNPSNDTWAEWDTLETETGATEKAQEAEGRAGDQALIVAETAEQAAKRHANNLFEPLHEQVETMNEDLVKLDADVIANKELLDRRFSATGGTNRVANSVGFADLDFWNGSGTITTVQNAELETVGPGSAFVLGSSSYMEQILYTEPGEWTISMKINKPETGSGYVEIEHDGTIEQISINAGEEYDYRKVYIAFELNGTETRIRIGTNTSSEMTVTSVLMNAGDYPQVWSFAQDEIYGTGYRFNKNGLRVYQLDGDQYTQVTSEEFAGYAKVGGEWSRVFALNGDTTEVEKLQARSEISMTPIKIVKVDTANSKGWAFVRGG